MNRSDPSPALNYSTSPTRITGRFCIVRTAVALAFLIIAAGITATEWLDSNGEAAVVNTAQRP